MELIEVKVLDEILLVPFDDSSTISSVSAAAVLEYQSFNLKKSPQKVVCVKDLRGRVLSKGLKIVEHKIDLNLEVIVEEYSNDDKIAPTDIERLYRDWQIWTTEQIKDHIQSLAYSSIPPSPDVTIIALLLEMSKSPSERIQLACVVILQILLTKFPQKQIIITAAETISELFTQTTHADVAISALECFKGLSPLQFKLFDGNKYLRSMFDIQHTLLRFSKEKQSVIFSAFTSLSALLGDSELQNVLNPNSKQSASTLTMMSDERKSEDTTEKFDNLTVAPENSHEKSDVTLLSNAINNNMTDPNQIPSAPPKKFNLSRILSLLVSEDAKIRLYSLEKLYNKLQSSTAEAMQANSVRVVGPNSGSSGASRKPSVAVNGGALTSRDDATISTDANSIKPATPALQVPAQPVPATPFISLFTSEREIDVLVKALFACLKASIHSPRQGQTSSQSSSSSPGEQVATSSGGSGEQKASQPPPVNKVKRNPGGGLKDSDPHSRPTVSTAARLIQTALKSPQSDVTAVRLVMNCLWLLVHYPFDIITITTQNGHTKHKHIHKLNNTPITQIQTIFTHSAREWYRLLLTLSHCDESFVSQFDVSDVAEKAAYMFSLVTVEGMHNNWSEAGIKIESEALYSFMSVPQKPNYRLYIALSYLSHFTRHTVNTHDHNNNNNNNANDLKARFLKDLISSDAYRLLVSLWHWSTSLYANHKSRLLSMTCIAELSTHAEVVKEFLKLDPVQKLLQLITHAVRDRSKDPLNFTPQYVFDTDTQSSSNNSNTLDDIDYRTNTAGGGGVSGSGGLWEFNIDESDSDSDTINTENKHKHKHKSSRHKKHHKHHNHHDFYSSSEDQENDTYDSDINSSSGDNSDEEGDSGGENYADKMRRKLEKLRRNSDSHRKQFALVVPSGPPLKVITIDPDVLLIRVVLKTLVNILNSPIMLAAHGSTGQQLQQRQYIQEVISVLRELHVGLNASSERGGGSVSLKRIARRDDVIGFYFTLLIKMGVR